MGLTTGFDTAFYTFIFSLNALHLHLGSDSSCRCLRGAGGFSWGPPEGGGRGSMPCVFLPAYLPPRSLLRKLQMALPQGHRMLRVVKCTCSGLPQGRALCSASAFVSHPLYFLGGGGSGWGGCLELVFSQLPKQPPPTAPTQPGLARSGQRAAGSDKDSGAASAT